MILMEDSCHYLIYSILFITSTPVTSMFIGYFYNLDGVSELVPIKFITLFCRNISQDHLLTLLDQSL